MGGKQVRPVLPLYLAALTWPVASLVFPPYALGNLAIVAVCSAVVYGVARRFCPMRVVRTLVPYATGSEDVDAMLNGIAANLDALHALNEAIPDTQLSHAMDRMERPAAALRRWWKGLPIRHGRSIGLRGIICQK